jgi:hypothetical protein
MPPVERPICRFAAEPPQEELASGRWAQLLRSEFMSACLRIEAEPDAIGDAQELVFHPDRTWCGRTYVPITARTSTGFELYGHVSFTPSDPEDDDGPASFEAWADYAEETADDHPEWRIDLNAEVIGEWRGAEDHVAAMTLVWGRRLLDDGVVVSAELAGETVDQCVLVSDRFTLVAPDAYAGDYLEVALWDDSGAELARESLYDDDDDDDDDEEPADAGEVRA